MKFLFSLFLLIAASSFGAVPSYTSFRGTGGIFITTNPPTGLIVIDGSGIFTSSGTNATIATSTNGVLVAVASTNINFVRGSNVFLAATNIGSTTHIAINAFTPVPFIEGAVTNLLLTWILPILTVDSLTVSNLLAAPPLSSVQYNSNGITRGSAGFIYTNGQVRVADIVVAGQGMEVTAGSFVLNGGDTALVAWNGLGRMRWPTGGVARLEDDAALSFNRLQLGGDTAAFPAIGRTNGDVIILGGNGAFKAGDATNKLRAPAVFIANDSGMGTPLLRLENPLNGIGWDLEINSHAETYILGLGFNDETYAMVWELGGNVGIGITNPTVRLDVQGRFMARSNVYFPNISSNATPVAFLATDSDGQVYETAVPAGGAASTPGGNSGAIQFNEGGTFAGTNLLVFDRTNNRVGIGIDTPSARLEVRSTTTQTRLAYDTDTYASITVNSAGLTSFLTEDSATGDGFSFEQTVGVAYAAGDPTTFDLIRAVNSSATSGAASGIWGIVGGQNVGGIAFIRNGVVGDSGSTALFYGSGAGLAEGMRVVHTTGSVGIGTNDPFSKLDVVGGIRSHNVTASRMAAFHTDKTLTNGATTVALLDNFFTMGISNIVAADSGLVIRTNAGVLTISNTVAAAGGTTVSGSTGQIAFINVAGTGLTNANGGEAGAVNRPGFGYFPTGPHGGFGGLMVFANLPMGMLTVGHPNTASDFETFATAMVLSNRYNGTGFKQELAKFEGVDVGAGSDPSSTLSTWATWSGSTRTIAAEVRKDGMGFFAHGTMYPSNSLASTMPTAAELGPGGYWVGNSNASLVAVYSLNGSSTIMKILAP